MPHDKKKKPWRVWKKENPEEYRGWKVAYREATKAEKKAQMQEYRKHNREKIRMNNAAYRARKLNAAPSWLTADMREEILSKYEEAKELSESTGIEHHVDHIIALKGEKVSGLHVPWNLQVIPAKTNWRKGNSLEE